jgi:hypothetical protein
MSQTNAVRFSCANFYVRMTTLDHDELKEILEPYRILFNTMVNHISLTNIIRITIDDNGYLLVPGAPCCYTLHKDPHGPCSKGLFVLPPGTQPQIADAYVKQYYYDFAMETMFSPISARLQKIGARVNSLAVVVDPIIVLHFAGDEPQDLVHYMFAVTSQYGEQYITNFTIEQYGFPEEYCWFMKMTRYMDLCTIDGNWKVAKDDVLDLTRDGMGGRNLDAGNRKMYRALRKACWELDWDGLDALDRDERMAVVKKKAGEIFGAVAKELQEQGALVEDKDEHGGE